MGRPSCARRSCTTRPSCRASARAAARTSRCATRTCRSSAARSCPAGGGRSIFALPWLGHTLVGTTDNDYEGPLDHVQPSEDDIDYLLDAVNDVLRHRRSAPGDLTGAFAGVRPLISTGDPKKSVDISRKAELYETS